MSDFVSNLGTFKPSTFSGDKPKSRMAGDYLSEFTQKYSDNSQQNQVNNRKDFNTFKGDNGKSYGTNTEKMLFGKTPKSSTNNNASNPDNINTKDPNQVAGSAASTTKPTTSNALGEINYDAMADARMATATKGEINGGVNKDYWMKQYQKNNSEYEQNKALMASYQGPKTWDEFEALDQSRTGNVKDRNTGTINDYNAYTKYATAKEGVSHWEKATAQYRN